MIRKAGLLSVVLLLALAVAVWASVTLSYPVQVQTVGSNTDVRGMASQKAFMIVYSEVYRGDNNAYVKRVPGIRHWTQDDGSFAFRIATPLVFRGPSTKLHYKIHARAYSQPSAGTEAPDLGEAVVTVYSQ